jgi:hypothetical protein
MTPPDVKLDAAAKELYEGLPRRDGALKHHPETT